MIYFGARLCLLLLLIFQKSPRRFPVIALFPRKYWRQNIRRRTGDRLRRKAPIQVRMRTAAPDFPAVNQTLSDVQDLEQLTQRIPDFRP